MDIKALDKALQEILKKRDELNKLDYNNPKYDDLEEQLHDLEDALQVKYGEYLEEALQDVHDQVCPDSEVLMPIAYLGKGIFVEADKYCIRINIRASFNRDYTIEAIFLKIIMWSNISKSMYLCRIINK